MRKLCKQIRNANIKKHILIDEYSLRIMSQIEIRIVFQSDSFSPQVKN